MSGLLQRVTSLEASGSDAILFFSKATLLNTNTPHMADAIIKKTKKDTGHDWSFYVLMQLDGTYVPGCGVHGDIDTVIRAAEYQFGSKTDDHDLCDVNSFDKDFLKALVSAIH